ncbi:nicotinate phosphoribosyltransferase [Trametes maxima]|nr:nicotinate phosphoribosyltransferase [Trametes maxima]
MSDKTDDIVLPASLLDTDLYKFTMQQAVLQHFPGVEGTYRFTHRDRDVFFTRACFERFQRSASQFDRLQLSQEEREWLAKACPYLKPSYLDYLASYRFKPEHLSLRFVPVPDDEDKNARGDGSARGQIKIDVAGPWQDTILWEVPLMASLSEIYFTTVDKDWNYDGQEEQAYAKAKTLLEAGCTFSEFGTRRRRSYRTHDLIMDAILRAQRDSPNATGKVAGTSNMHLAKKYNVTPMGTIAHEWFMGVGALKGYEGVNATALRLWEEVYPNVLLIALTDTFSTEAFYKDFVTDKHFAQHWVGLRQDSGDPYVFAPRAKQVYEQLGVDYSSKSIIFSDALNVEKALKLKKQCDELGFRCSFGIGTSLSNDFKKASSGEEKSRALNMVIKLSSVAGKPTVKISDEITKNTGDPATVRHVKEIFGIPISEKDEVVA